MILHFYTDVPIMGGMVPVATMTGMRKNAKPTYTVREAAALCGLSQEAVRVNCRDGRCPCDYHEFPGTSRGFYLLNDESIKWLRENVSPRNRSAS